MSGEVYSEGAVPYSRNLADNSAEFLSGASLRAESGAAALWRRILLGIVLVEIPLQIDTYLFHDHEQALLGAISGFNISLTTICLVLLYAQWLPRMIVESANFRISKSLLAFVVLSAVSMIWAADKNLSLFELCLIGQAFLIFTYVVNTVTTRSEVLFLVKLLIVGLVIQGLFMAATRLLLEDLEAGPLSFRIHNAGQRVCGSLGSPNVAASYLALLLPLGLCLLFANISRGLFFLTTFALLLGGGGMIMTMSRGGWVSAAVAFLVCFVGAYRRQWLSPRVIAVVCSGAVILAICFQGLLLNRMFGEDNNSAQSRFPLYHISTLMIWDNPLGVGANNWELAARPYAGRGDLRGEWFFTVHNKYLLIWAEIGFLGLLAYIAFLLSTIKKGWLAWKLDDRLLAPIALGCAAGIAGQMIHMMFDIFNSRVQVQMLWLMAALVVVIGNLAADKESTEGSPSNHE